MPVDLVSADYAVVLTREALKQGHDLLTDLPFDLETLEQLDFVPIDPFMILLERFTKLSEGLHWGFELGQKLSMFSHGQLGFGAISAPTIGDGLAFFARYISTRAGYVFGEIKKTPETLTLRLSFDVPAQPYRQRMCQTLSVILEELISRSGGPPESIHWTFPDRGLHNKANYRIWLKGNIAFNGNCFEANIPASVANTASTFHNPNAYQAAKTQCELLYQQNSQTSFTSATARLLQDRFEQRLGEPYPQIEIPVAAAAAVHLGCSPRTLFRELKAEGTSFKQIKDEIMRVHLIDLSSQGLSPTTISEKLGFSDTGNFSRACKRLIGMTPGELIRTHEHEAGYLVSNLAAKNF